jgi:hypothetical protein
MAATTALACDMAMWADLGKAVVGGQFATDAGIADDVDIL